MFRFIPDTNTQFQAMRGGEVQIINLQPQQQVVDIAKQSNINVQRGSQFAWEHVDFQLGAGGHPALKKKFVREAIVTGINRAQIRQVAYGQVAPNLPPLNNVIYKNFQDEYVAQVPAVRLQPEEGHLVASGQRLHRRTGDAVRPQHDIYSCPGVGKLSFEFRSTSGNQSREISFQVMQAQPARRHRAEAGLHAHRPDGDAADPELGQTTCVGGTSTRSERSTSTAAAGRRTTWNYCDRAVSRVLLKSNETLDPKARTALFNGR